MSPHKVVDVEDSDSDAVSSNYDGSSIKSEGSGVQDGPVPLSSEEPIAIIGMGTSFLSIVSEECLLT